MLASGNMMPPPLHVSIAHPANECVGTEYRDNATDIVKTLEVVLVAKTIEYM